MSTQLSLFDEENEPYRSTMKPPGPDYPWRFHELRCAHEARGVHPLVASMLADAEEKAERRALEKAADALPNLSRWDRSTRRRRLIS